MKVEIPSLAQFRKALAMVSPAVPARSPKPVLENVLLTADGGKAYLHATNLEAFARAEFEGVQVHDGSFSCLLPVARLGALLKLDTQAAIDVSETSVTIKAGSARLTFPTESPDLFPGELARFDGPGAAVPIEALRRVIRQLVPCTDEDSTRYALGGCLFEFAELGLLRVVGTNGRCLGVAEIPCEYIGDNRPTGSAVVPGSALKMLAAMLGNLSSDQPVIIRLEDQARAWFEAGPLRFASRLVEGRFPRYQDAFPKEQGVKSTVAVDALKSAVAVAASMTSAESRGLNLDFGDGSLTVQSRAADNGESEITLDVQFSGEIGITFAAEHLAKYLGSLGEVESVEVELFGAESPAIFRTTGYDFLISPITRAR